MPTLLFTDIGTGVVSGERPAPADSAADLVADLLRTHRGNQVRSRGTASVALFDTAAKAVACALAVRSRVAAHNRTRRGERPIVARLSVDHLPGGANEANISDLTWQRAAAIGAVASGGRVLISRPVYLEARNARVFAFLPCGPEQISGGAEPVEVFEAISIGARNAVATPTARSGASPSAAANDQIPSAAASSILPASLSAWMFVAVCAGVCFALSRVVAVILTPLQVLNDVFQLAGMSLFGAGGSDWAAVLGGLLVPLIVPCVATFHYVRERRQVPARLSIFWIGQSLLSLGQEAMTLPEPESFAAAQRAGLMEALRAIGADASLHQVAQVVGFAGGILIATAAVAASGFGRHRGAQT